MFQERMLSGYSSTLVSLGRALSHRAFSYRMAGSVRAAYLSFKNGVIFSADALLQNKDPVFKVVDWEGLGAELDFDASVPAVSFSRSTSPLEKICLGMLLKLQDPAVIFELGTYRGATTLLLYRNAPATARIFSFDIPSDVDRAPGLDRSRLIDLEASGLEDDFDRAFFPRSERVTQVYADLRSVDWRHVRTLPKPDFVFIDADHSYEGCLRDTRHVLDWVGDDAMVIWHDAIWRKFAYLQGNYGVHASVVEATSPAAGAYTFRIRDTSLVIRSKRHRGLLRRHGIAG